MAESPVINLRHVARGVSLPVAQVQAVVELLDEGNTVPFITRYRKDRTGGLDEEQIRDIQNRLTKMRLLAERKQTILRSIESQGKLSEELAKQIKSAGTTKRLEDLYLPYRPKKQTLATLARSRGLEQLAQEILAADRMAADLDARAADFVNTLRGVPTPADALLGAGHILAEQFSEQAELRQKLREILQRTGKLTSQEIAAETKPPESIKEEKKVAAQPPVETGETAEVGDAKAEEKPSAKKPTGAQLRKKKAQEQKVKAFRDYFNYGEELRKAPPHRVLAINRGERAKILRVKIECDMAAVAKAAEEMLIPAEHPDADFLRGCVRDSLARLIVPGLERELRRELTDRAETHAVGVFAKNLRNLLLQPPVHDRRVLAVDPGFKSGCKLVALDQFGNVLEQAVIYIIGREQRLQQAKETVIDLIDRFNLSVVAIGNGTACRQTEDFFAKLIEEELARRGVAFVIVNEAGASVYSTSQLGREEFPDYDATVRGAISIGRRLQDPLSELVKIDPPSIGVGMYQHDVKAKHLRLSLDEVVESCVNYVGVDVNTASPALLKYVSGLNQLTARRVYEHRLHHGPFRNRRQLMDVPGFGEATFVQAAGFLKISAGDQPLDSTWIHPESYTVADRVLTRINCRMEDLAGGDKAKVLAERVAQIDVAAASEQLGVGELLLKDILAQLARPGRDPREDLPKPVFKQGVLKLEDLAEGMELTGTVLNVVDFGAFVDIGMHDSGLVHVSQLADKFIRDPHEAVAVGDVVKVWVVGVDKDRRRVSLTMIKPGSKPAADSSPKDKKTFARENRAKGPRRMRTPAEGEKTAAKERGKRPAAKDERRADSDHRRRRPPDRPRGKDSGESRTDRRNFQPKKQHKPLVPITKAMKEGKEAMRTFGDLAQYFNVETAGEKQQDRRRGENKKKRQPQSKTSETQKAADADANTDAGEQRQEIPAVVADTGEQRQEMPSVVADAGEQQQEIPLIVADTVEQEQEIPLIVADTVEQQQEIPAVVSDTVEQEQEIPGKGDSRILP